LVGPLALTFVQQEGQFVATQTALVTLLFVTERVTPDPMQKLKLVELTPMATIPAVQLVYNWPTEKLPLAAELPAPPHGVWLV
jgi:hypothetical protein